MKCLNCDNNVPPYFRKYCSVFCRKNIRKWATLSYRHYKKQYCEICRMEPPPDKLHVHHLNENPADNRPDNLITLCQSCHTKIHQATKKQSTKNRKKKKRNRLSGVLTWMLGHYSVPGGKELPKPKGILDHFM